MKNEPQRFSKPDLASATSTMPQAEPPNHGERISANLVQSRTRRAQRHPTFRQSELRERSWYMHCDGFSVRQIAAQLQINKETVLLYIRAERTKRVDDINADREARKAEAIAFYQGIKRRALRMHDTIQHTLETISEATNYEGQVRIQEHYLSDATKAQERIDKIEGLDAPLKVGGTLRALSEALFVPEDSKPVALNP
jgi:transposase